MSDGDGKMDALTRRKAVLSLVHGHGAGRGVRAPIVEALEHYAEMQVLEAEYVQRSIGPTSADETFFQSIRMKLADNSLTRPMEQHAIIYSCIHALAMNLSQTSWVTKPSKTENAKPVQNELQALLDDPNPLMSTVDFIYFLIAWLSLSGECIIVKEGQNGRLKSVAEVPAELWPLNGGLFTHHVDPDTKLVQYWVLNEDKPDEIVYKPHEVIHLRYPNPYNPYRGLAPLVAAMMAATTDWDAVRYNQAFFKNGGDPGGILTYEGTLTETKRKELEAKWADRHVGAAKRNRVAVLDRNLKYDSIAASHKDMEFTTQREWNRYEILAVFRVPPAEAGFYEDVNYATAKEEARRFWTRTLMPIGRLIKDAFWAGLYGRCLGGRYIGQLDFTQVPELQQDLKEQISAAKELVALGFTQEQAAAKVGLQMEVNEWQKVGWADNPNKVPWDLLLMPDEPEPAFEESPAKVEAPKSAPPVGDSVGAEPGEVAQPAEAERPRQGRPRRRSYEERRQYWKSLQETYYGPEERKFLGMMRRFFVALRTDQLAKVGSAEKHQVVEAGRVVIKAKVAHLLFDPVRWKKRLAEASRPHYKRALVSAQRRIAEEVGSATRWKDDSKAVRGLTEEFAKRVTGVTDTVRAHLRSTLAEGIGDGETVGDLKNRVKRIFQVSLSRALTIARTEVGSASNRASVIAMEELGVPKHEWLSAGDDYVRQSHKDVDGEIVAIGEKFSNGLLYPHDPDGDADEVISCRCDTAPVYDDEDIEDDGIEERRHRRITRTHITRTRSVGTTTRQRLRRLMQRVGATR